MCTVHAISSAPSLSVFSRHFKTFVFCFSYPDLLCAYRSLWCSTDIVVELHVMSAILTMLNLFYFCEEDNNVDDLNLYNCCWGRIVCIGVVIGGTGPKFCAIWNRLLVRKFLSKMLNLVLKPYILVRGNLGAELEFWTSCWKFAVFSKKCNFLLTYFF